MNTRLDEKTVIPLGWVAGCFVSLLSIVVIAAFWVSMVDFRLQRIEEKLGIPPFRSASIDLIHDAVANQK